MKKLLALLLCAAAGVRAADYAVGADLSFLKQAEDRGTVFKDNNEGKPGLQIFKDHGYNWIRLASSTRHRSFPTTWNTPSPWPRRPSSSDSSSCSTTTTRTPGPIPASSSSPKPGKR
ncbi:MAG: glycosyl hydrolase 53 family protein [Acidobacteriia bacterium]|nr:glycosyl hydrolase 53 family protein [Terriglobia bacterium]